MAPGTPAPTFAPLSTVAPAPTALRTAVPTVAPATPAAAAPMVYISIEPNNAIDVQEVARTTCKGAIRLVWSTLGDALAVESRSTVSLFGAGSLSIIRTTTPSPPSKILDFSPDSNTLATTGNQNQVELSSMATGELLRTIHPGEQFTEGIFSPDGQTFAVSPLMEIAATLWDTSTGREIKKLTGFKTAAPVYGFTFGPYGRTLIWRARATVQLQDIASGRLGPVFSHEDFVSAVALAPGGRTLATVVPGRSGNQMAGMIRLWDSASGKELAILTQNNGVARSIAFSPDGRLLAASSGNTIELWDVARRQILAALLGHTGPVDLVAFSPDGAALASASDDGTVHLWRLPPMK